MEIWIFCKYLRPFFSKNVNFSKLFGLAHFFSFVSDPNKTKYTLIRNAYTVQKGLIIIMLF